jgi:hypothetical protein
MASKYSVYSQKFTFCILLRNGEQKFLYADPDPMLLGLLDPGPDPLVIGMDPDSFIIKQK